MEEFDSGLIEFVRNSKLLSEKDCEEIRNLQSGIKNAIRSAKTQFQKLKVPEEPKLVLPDVAAIRERVEAFVVAKKAADRVHAEWRKKRLENIDLLRSTVESLYDENVFYDVSRLSGLVCSAFGGVLMVGGLAAAPFTLGASSSVTALGTFFGGLGTAQAGAFSLIKGARLSTHLKRVNKNLEEENESYKLIIRMFERQEEMANSLKEILSFTNRGIFSELWENIKEAVATLGCVQASAQLICEKLLPSLGLHIPEAWIFQMSSVLLVSAYLLRRKHLAFDLVNVTSKIVLYNAAQIVQKSMLGAGGMASTKLILQGVMATVSLAMDIIALHEMSTAIKNGTIHKHEQELDEAADYLQKEFEEIEKIYE